MNLKKSLNSIRGWLPKEPTLPRLQTNRISKLRNREPAAWERKVFKTTLIINPIIMAIFFTINFTINPHNKNTGLTLVIFGFFALTLALVGFLVYLYFKRQAKSEGEMKN